MTYRNGSFWGAILISLSIAGYPAISSLSIFLDIENRFISIPFRTFILLLALGILIFKAQILKVKNIFFWKIWWLFWSLYLLRLIIDYLIFPENLRLPFWEYLSYMGGTCLVPAFACAFCTDEVTLQKSLDYIFWLLLLTCLGVLLTIPVEFVLSINFIDLFNIRLETKTLNPISISHVGFMLSTLALIKLSSNGSVYRNISLIALFLFGILFGNSGGSRGPLVAFAASILVLFFSFLLKTGSKKNSALIFFLVVFSIFGYLLISTSFNSTLMRRISSIDPSDEIRFSLYRDGFNLFIDNFFFGAGIEPLGFWPHNTILEAFILNGVISGLLYLALLLMASLKSLKIIIFDSKNLWIVMLFLQFLLIAMVDAPLYQSNQLWVLMAVIMGRKISDYRKSDA